MNMRSVADVLYARRWVVFSVLILALLASPLFVKLLRPTYEATAQVALVGNNVGNAATIIPSTDLPDVAMSTGSLQRVIDELRLPFGVDDLRLRLVIKMPPHSNIMPVTYRDKNAELAVRVSNAVADSTVAEFHSLASRQYDQEIGQIRQQLGDQQRRIRAVDLHLQQAVQKDSYTGGINALETLSAKLSDLDTARAQASSTLVADSAIAKTQAAAGPLASVIKEQALQSDPYYVALRAGQAKDASDYAFQKAGYTDAYPGLPGLRERIDRENRDVTAAGQIDAVAHAGASTTYAQVLVTQHAAVAQVAGDTARVAAIDKQIADVQGHLRDLPVYGVTTDALRLERDSAGTAYGQLATRLQLTMADQAQAAALSSLVVLDHADSAAPHIPRVMMMLLLALLIVVLAIGGAFAAEFLDPRIRNTIDIEDLYGVKHFGTITR